MHANAPHRPEALILAGPTASGKTAVAVALAQRFALEIVCADSMQIYSGMGIGTAQPTPEEQTRARFHVFGSQPPQHAFDVQQFLDACDQAHREILARGRTPLYVGGTGMYLRALRWGLGPDAGRDDAFRGQLQREAEEQGWPALHRRLAKQDPEAAARILPNDHIRITRALEVLHTTGRRFSAWTQEWETRQARFPHRLLVLCGPRHWLRERIARRTRQMLEEGWIEEVRALLSSGITPDHHCFKALGYREIAEYIESGDKQSDGRETLESTIVTRTAQFARRQMIWLRSEIPATWIATAGDGVSQPLGTLEKLLANAGIAHV